MDFPLFLFVHTEQLQPDQSGIQQKKAQDGITSTPVTL